MKFSEEEILLECVPNFSEGKNEETISAIAASIRKLKAVKLLHIDSGYDANRTVMTFAGSANAVLEAAFQAIKTASDRIDMREQKGVHPRFGATDVCPIVPLKNCTMEQAVAYSIKLAERVGSELGIPVYLYENSAQTALRKNLSYLRKGNYEAIAQKITQEEWKPDFGPQKFNPKAGNIAIGARPFLIAYNISLDTKDLSIAKRIAAEIRTSSKSMSPNKCKALKAIGWPMPNYDCVQVSMNITDFKKTGLHHAFEAVKSAAANFKVGLLGSELIGLVPLEAMLDSANYFKEKVVNSSAYSEKELIALAVEYLLFDKKHSFSAEDRILEYLLERD